MSPSTAGATTAVRAGADVQSAYRYYVELRSEPDASGRPLHREEIETDLPALVDETYVRGVLAGKLPGDVSKLTGHVAPVWSDEPLVEQIEVDLTVADRPRGVRFAARFSRGGWSRRATAVVSQLRKEGSLEESETAYSVLVAEKRGDGGPARHSCPLDRLPIVDETLEDFGVRELGDGSLVPDRPIICNGRVVEEIVERCFQAGVTEIGGAMLGKLIRLPEPLPGTSTRIVTVLSACIADSRHQGTATQLAFDPVALVEASRVAELRNCGEEVLSVYHSHCWNSACGLCNESETCPLTECSVVSTLDYQLLESLFPSKAAVMPIAGRKLGAPPGRPVMEIHAWRGGALQTVRWQQYRD